MAASLWLLASGMLLALLGGSPMRMAPPPATLHWNRPPDRTPGSALELTSAAQPIPLGPRRSRPWVLLCWHYPTPCEAQRGHLRANAPHTAFLPGLSPGGMPGRMWPVAPWLRGVIALLLTACGLVLFAWKHCCRQIRSWKAERFSSTFHVSGLLVKGPNPATTTSRGVDSRLSPQLPFEFDTSWSGVAKHAAHCRHILSRLPTKTRLRGGSPVCLQCWANQPACVCHALQRHSPPPGVEVVLWMHHKEWATPSNTGVLLARSLQGSRLLMKGLPEHDLELRSLLADPQRYCIVLWPGACLGHRLTTASEVWAGVQGEAGGAGPKVITLILLDSTWPGARRMKRRLPEAITCWALSADDLLWHTAGLKLEEGTSVPSLISPLRKRKGVSPTEVCTAQAGVAALRALGLEDATCQDLLALIRLKVGRIGDLRNNSPRRHIAVDTA